MDTHLDARGVTLAYDLRGSGHPVVQLHGLTSSRARDESLLLDLTVGVPGLRVLRYDARGHGRSGGTADPATYTWDALAEDLLALLDHVVPGRPVHGVGQSMGTATLLTAAVRSPGRFASLSLGIPPTAWATRAAQASDYEAGATYVERGGMDAFVESTRATPLPPAAEPARPFTPPDVRAELLPSVFRGAARSDLPSPSALAAIDAPAAVLAWTGDPAHPESTAHALHDLLPGSTLDIASTPAQVRGWPGIIAEHIEAASRR